MAKKPSRLQRTAYHEAGHAVASYILHGRLISISIVPDIKDNTLGHFQASVPTFHPDENAPNLAGYLTAKGRTLRYQVETRIIILLAGPVAEKLFIDHANRKGASSDLSNVASLLDYIGTCDEKERIAYLNWLWHRTRVTLISEPYWEAVQTLAKELIKRRHIGERLARKIIKESIETRIEQLKQSLERR
jgi:hypothetical protein